jgi:hypothetical protein
MSGGPLENQSYVRVSGSHVGMSKGGVHAVVTAQGNGKYNLETTVDDESCVAKVIYVGPCGFTLYVRMPFSPARKAPYGCQQRAIDARCNNDG